MPHPTAPLHACSPFTTSLTYCSPAAATWFAQRRAGEFPSERFHRSAGSVPSRGQFELLSIALRAESGLSPLRVVCKAYWVDDRCPISPPPTRPHALHRHHCHHAPQSSGSWTVPSVKTMDASGIVSAPSKVRQPVTMCAASTQGVPSVTLRNQQARRTASTSTHFASSRTPLLGVEGSVPGPRAATFPSLWTGCGVQLRAG